MTRYQDIPKFTRHASYAIDVSWRYLPDHYIHSIFDDKLDVNPEFQREYVWTNIQKERYVEYILKGGASGKDIYFNCPGWNGGKRGEYVLVDGKQRLDAVLGYLNNEFKVFDKYHNDYTDKLDIMVASFKWHINDLDTYQEVLQWYIDLNCGETIHTDAELNKVKDLIKNNPNYQTPIDEILIKQSSINDREALKKAVRNDLERKNKNIEVLTKITKPSRRK